MPRPEIPRRVGCLEAGQAFKPVGRPVRELESETLQLDELEALRLADHIGLYQEAAAEQMGVSRPTFTRILARARGKVARALVEGQVLVIGEGTVVESPERSIPCPVHGGRRRRGRGCRCHGQNEGTGRHGRPRRMTRRTPR